MLHGLYVSGLGALGQSVRLDLIANNLANVNTPGYRRDQVTFKERLVEALEDFPDLQYYNSLVHRMGGAPFIDKLAYDKNPGGFEATGRELDFAINGSGWFTVRNLATDELFYTRAGNFLVDSQGRLVTSDGKYQVVADDGVGISVDPDQPGLEIRVDPDGSLFQGGVFQSRFRVVDFTNAEGIRKYGENLFTAFDSETVAPASFRVEQATLEVSSVNPVIEMADMIKTIRAIESNLQMVRIQDGTLDRVVNEFGRPAR